MAFFFLIDVLFVCFCSLFWIFKNFVLEVVFFVSCEKIRDFLHFRATDF